MKLVVTTGYQPTPERQQRAERVSQRLDAPLVVRRAWEVLWRDTDADALYVVGTHHDELRTPGAAAACFVEQGLLKMKLQRGPGHPLLRAVRGSDATVASVVDATMGVAHDALFLACALGASVHGIERSLPLWLLLEEGLPRLQRQFPGAGALSCEHGDAAERLGAMPDGAADAVFLDPMMSRAKGSSPTFDALRMFAWPERANAALLREAARVARRRVVLKLGRGAPLPPDAPYAFPRQERGGHVTYHVHEKTPAAQR